MSAQRSDGQVTVLIAMDRELRCRLEEASREKSRFIRTAIREKIERVSGQRLAINRKINAIPY